MIMLFSMEGKFDSVIQGQATTAAVDLDTNTAGGTTKETHVSLTHTQMQEENKQDVNMLSLAGH